MTDDKSGIHLKKIPFRSQYLIFPTIKILAPTICDVNPYDEYELQVGEQPPDIYLLYPLARLIVFLLDIIYVSY